MSARVSSFYNLVYNMSKTLLFHSLIAKILSLPFANELELPHRTVHYIELIIWRDMGLIRAQIEYCKFNLNKCVS